MADSIDTRDVDRREASAADAAAGIVTARRRLMLGAAAVLPSIVTLPAGATRALESANCIVRAQPSQAPHARFTDAPDEWLRKRVFSGHAVKGGRTAYCVTWDQPNILAIATLEKTATGMAYRALPGTTWLIGEEGNDAVKIGIQCPPYDPTQGAGMGSYCYAESIENINPAPETYALVYVDDTGLSCSLERSPGMYPVRESCWASLMGDTGSNLG